ncbi:hypothetical protein A2W67_03440 [Candidatus Nomurabacteria bacterium RIFCSPLOWO2_02_40_28]|uniref:Metal-dependent protein hydrolase n=2 Tax=Candidatus Nomuraibacteriota TaxID=1752729 RepID=A0A837HX09_9BACT|nr:MAG: Metal-dependent protein hydrolase [Candidatus Nomurabacteria bacterium GW2011_GWD2_39_12]KKR20938.1 MAG: Metal-dependent protein hydrolase [Candidatus Nomurabacteria bacterium GW2011_GWC2_39_41]KKR37183.1 MAG: Metal-dependent protein hydrolase [Candidatus Nomurabacteria bacterium GW2011_GWE2_40_10]KKR38887.1 MAG: Metal-dependent protein hydrolase [Candidatus Nomurabacteria bacterium GW2011_GWB1_40_11]KKR40129.1 MAG: Metal-dependent protein hydrolase [Parcubacteria group bacterium GW2011
MNQSSKKLITHNGSFHTDDIFAAATLSLLLERKGESYEIIRTRDEEIIKNGKKDGQYVFDVGGVYDAEQNRFDHHQVGGAGKNKNNIEYSSFGLVWEKFGEEFCGSSEVADIIEKKLVAPVDAHDNGVDLVKNISDVSPYHIQHFFSSMNPTWREEDFDSDKMFLEAVAIAKKILLREVTHITDFVLAEKSVISFYSKAQDKRIIILDKNYPSEYILTNFPEPLFVIYPRERDTWGAKAIRTDVKSFKNRKDFPVSWAGLRDEELQKASGVSDAVFCHRALFLAVAKSPEGATKLAQIALESLE